MDSAMQLTFYNAKSGTSGPPGQQREIKKSPPPCVPVPARVPKSSIILPSTCYFCQRLPALLAFMIQSNGNEIWAGCFSPWKNSQHWVQYYPCMKAGAPVSKGHATSAARASVLAFPITIRNVCTCTFDAKLSLSTEVQFISTCA